MERVIPLTVSGIVQNVMTALGLVSSVWLANYVVLALLAYSIKPDGLDPSK